jgi:hypothetical protein
VDGVLQEQPGARRAHLPGVQERAGERGVHGGLEVGVREHDVRVLAAELQRHLLHVLGRGPHDRASGLQPAGEGDEVDARRGHERGAGHRSRAEHEVDDAVREPRLLDGLDQRDRRERRDLARLEDDGVAGRERGRELPRHLQQRVVPRRDQRAHPDRLVDDAADDRRVAGVDEAARVGARERPVVAEDGDDVVHVHLALAQRLAGVERLQPGDAVAVGDQEVRDAQQQLGAPGRGRRRPGAAVEGGARGADGGRGVVRGGLVDGLDHRGVERVDDLARAAVRGADPRAVDEQFRHRRFPPPSAAVSFRWRMLRFDRFPGVRSPPGATVRLGAHCAPRTALCNNSLARHGAVVISPALPRRRPSPRSTT